MKVSKEFKENYNKLIQREIKGRNYIDNPKRTEAEINKYLPVYMKICDELTEMIEIYERITKSKISNIEATEGFKI